MASRNVSIADAYAKDALRRGYTLQQIFSDTSKKGLITQAGFIELTKQSGPQAEKARSMFQDTSWRNLSDRKAPLTSTQRQVVDVGLGAGGVVSTATRVSKWRKAEEQKQASLGYYPMSVETPTGVAYASVPSQYAISRAPPEEPRKISPELRASFSNMGKNKIISQSPAQVEQQERPVSEIQPYNKPTGFFQSAQYTLSTKGTELKQKELRGEKLTWRQTGEQALIGLTKPIIGLGVLGYEFKTNPFGTIKNIGSGLKESGKRIYTGQGFPEVGQYAKERPVEALSYGAGEAILGKGIESTVSAVRYGTNLGISVVKGEPIAKTGKVASEVAGQELKVTYLKDIKGSKGNFNIEIIPEGSTSSLRTEATRRATESRLNKLPLEQRQNIAKTLGQEGPNIGLSKQSTRGAFDFNIKEKLSYAGKSGPIVTAQSGFKGFGQALKRTLFGSPFSTETGAGQLRISRLFPKRGGIVDAVTGDIQIGGKRQVFVFEDAQISSKAKIYPKEPKGLPPVGKFRASTGTGEAELILTAGEIPIKGPSLGKVFLKGRRIEVISTTVQQPARSINSLEDLSKASGFTSKELKLMSTEPTTGITGTSILSTGGLVTTSLSGFAPSLPSNGTPTNSRFQTQAPAIPTTPRDYGTDVTTFMYKDTKTTLAPTGGRSTTVNYPIYTKPSPAYTSTFTVTPIIPTTPKRTGTGRSSGGPSYSSPIIPTGSGSTGSIFTTQTPPPTIPRTPRTGLFTGPPPTTFLDFKPDFQSNFLTSRRYGGRKGTAYTPSFTAIVFNIRGRRGRQSTGVGFRPITKGFKWPTLKNLKTQIKL